jgi:hypothetical protein
MTMKFLRMVQLGPLLGNMLGALLWSTLGAAPVLAQTTLDLKTGEWETTTVTQSSGLGGLATLPPGLLDKMPPEQRAAFEQRMKAAQAPHTTTRRHCTTKEDLAKGFHPPNERENCQYTIKTSTRTKQEMVVACQSDKMKTNGMFQVEAIDTGNVKGTMQMTSVLGNVGGGEVKGLAGQTANMSFSFTSKWIGPVCSESAKKTSLKP